MTSNACDMVNNPIFDNSRYLWVFEYVPEYVRVSYPLTSDLCNVSREFPLDESHTPIRWPLNQQWMAFSRIGILKWYHDRNLRPMVLVVQNCREFSQESLVSLAVSLWSWSLFARYCFGINFALYLMNSNKWSTVWLTSSGLIKIIEFA